MEHYIDNPYVRRPGVFPACFAGRSVTSKRYHTKLAKVKAGSYSKGMVLLGLKYIGKSTMLAKYKEIADAQNDNIMTQAFDCSWNETIAKDMEAFVNEQLNPPGLLRKANTWFWWTLDKIPHSAAETAVKIRSSIPLTTEGFAMRYFEFGMQLKANNKCVVFFIDNLHEASVEELRVMIGLMQITERGRLPILFMAAGHPAVRTKLLQATPDPDIFLEFHTLGKLDTEEVRSAFVLSARSYGRKFTEEALDEMVRICKGFPYLVQLMGYYVWKNSSTQEMTLAEVKNAVPSAKREMVNGLLESRRFLMTKKQIRFSVAMASLPATERTLENIISKLGGVEAEHIHTQRELLDMYLIYDNNENLLDFTAPLFDEYLLECEQNSESLE